MRLWHTDLIPYLPKSQLVAQWIELNSIYKKQDNHILINYVYNYGKEYLLYYSSCCGTKEKDVCDCCGDKSKCNFYERVRAEAAEEEKNLSTTKDVLEEIEGLIGEYWGTDPIYYVDSKNKEEDGAAKLCCKILEAIRMSRGGIDGENS